IVRWGALLPEVAVEGSQYPPVAGADRAAPATHDSQLVDEVPEGVPTGRRRKVGRDSCFAGCRRHAAGERIRARRQTVDCAKEATRETSRDPVAQLAFRVENLDRR